MNTRIYTVDETISNLVLLEPHFRGLNVDKLWCMDCITKHTYAIRGLSDEGVKFFSENPEPWQKLGPWAIKVLDMGELSPEQGDKLADEASEFRKDVFVPIAREEREKGTANKATGIARKVIGTFKQKRKDTWGNWSEVEVEVLSLSDPRNVRGKVSSGNWAVDYETPSPLGGTGKQTNTEYFWRKKEAEEWVDSIKSGNNPEPNRPPETKPELDTVMCSWCGKVMREGGPNISHGICDECLEKHFPEIDTKQKESSCPLCKDVKSAVKTCEAAVKGLEGLARMEPYLSCMKRELKMEES